MATEYDWQEVFSRGLGNGVVKNGRTHPGSRMRRGGVLADFCSPGIRKW
jgi:hypothetical protein